MTAVAAWQADPLTSEDVATDDKYPPHRNVRVDKDRWLAFGDAVGARKRSAWLSDFIDAVNRDPELWQAFHDTADERGEVFSAALVRAVSLYNARKR
jgi:hypothetical protein